MCDCYGHKCYLCDEVIPMHLGDFDTRRGEIRVLCHNHNFNEILPYIKNAVLWVMDLWPASQLWDNDEPDGGSAFSDSGHEAKEYGGKIIVIQALTENAKANWKHNHPNLLIDFIPIESSYFTTKDEEEENNGTTN